jgi:hypothetical protein
VIFRGFMREAQQTAGSLLALEQVLQETLWVSMFRILPFLSGCCSEIKVSEQL